MLNMAKASVVVGAMVIPNPKPSWFDQLREMLRFHHYALRIGEAQIREERMKSESRIPKIDKAYARRRNDSALGFVP